MPRSFPDMKSLTDNAKMRGFRQPYAGEDETSYRDAQAEFVAKVDVVEACEIRNGVGWDQQDPLLMMADLIGFKNRQQ